MPKILALVSSCKGCDHRKYDSGNRYNCDLVDEQIIDESCVAPFCPLTDFPSNQIAKLERTVQALQQSNDFGFYWAVMAFVVKKSGRTLSADGRYITFNQKEGDPVYLINDHIIEIDLQQGHIVFLHEKERYAFVTSTPPRLLREESYRIGDEDKKGWQEVSLETKMK